jgi:glycosyltransferase involved in cell wall biosynthesis
LDVITDGENGLLVENGNVSQLTDKLIYMIEHPEDRLRMGEAARRRADAFRIENLAKEWQHLFDSL